MISYISSESNRLTVTYSGNHYFHGNLPSSGLVRYTANALEAYDGSNWVSISSPASVSLTPDTIRTLEWAEQQRLREEKIKKMIIDNPTIMDLHNSVELAKEKLDVAIAMLYSDNKVNV